MKVSFNPSVNSNNKYRYQNFGSEAPKYGNYTPSDVRTAKLKQTVSTLSLLATATAILYFGFKIGAKNVKLKLDEKKKADIITPVVDGRILDIINYHP